MEGSPCLFPDEGFVPLQKWKEEQMTCRLLPGGGDDIFCARPIKRQGHTIASLDGNVSMVHIVRCPTGACASNNTCLTNRTGPGVTSSCLTAFVLLTIHFHTGCLPLSVITLLYPAASSFILLAKALSLSNTHCHHFESKIHATIKSEAMWNFRNT